MEVILTFDWSSLTAGEDVAGAGESQIGKDGTLKGVSDRSGRYKPGDEQTKQTLEAIEQQGVSLDNVKFTMERGQEKTFKDRHNVVDQIKGKGESVRDSLRKTGHLDKIENAQQKGMGKVVPTPKKGVEDCGQKLRRISDRADAGVFSHCLLQTRYVCRT